MEATKVIILAEIFHFTGQAKVDRFAIDLDSLLSEQRGYDEVMVKKYRLSLEAIRKDADEFAFMHCGRPADKT